MVKVALKTDPGRDPEKQVNEDACVHRETPFGHLVVVCDGMGGHVGGREASNAAIAAIVRTFELATPGQVGRALLELAVTRANEAVYQLGVGFAESERPGSTVVAVLVHEGGTEIAHVGDSRCYRVHDGGIVQLTKDHSMVQQLVDLGALTPEQAKRHPDANRITRALGTDWSEHAELLPAPVAHVAGDTFVLCSDGLSDLVEPEDMLRIVSSAPPEQAAAQLVELANARGGHDNVTVAVVRTETPARELGAARSSEASVRSETMPLAVTEPMRPVARTLDDAPSGRTVPMAAASSSGELPPSRSTGDPEPELDREPPPRRNRVGLFVGLLFVLAGLGAAAYAYVLHERAEHPKHRPSLGETEPASATVRPEGASVLLPLAASATPEEVESLRPLHVRDAGR